MDHIVKEMALAGLANHMRLAKLAIEETQRGVYEDKIIKNLFATEYIYHSIKYEKTVGIFNENEEEDYLKLQNRLVLLPVLHRLQILHINCII